MKTKSITSIAALFGVAVILNASALAGPDPQLVPSLLRDANNNRKSVTHEKKVTIALTAHGKGIGTAKPVTDTGSTVVVVPGPHGDKFIYRR